MCPAQRMTARQGSSSAAARQLETTAIHTTVSFVGYRGAGHCRWISRHRQLQAAGLAKLDALVLQVRPTIVLFSPRRYSVWDSNAAMQSKENQHTWYAVL
jgi:hypothetical protein